MPATLAGLPPPVAGVSPNPLICHPMRPPLRATLMTSSRRASESSLPVPAPPSPGTTALRFSALGPPHPHLHVSLPLQRSPRRPPPPSRPVPSAGSSPGHRSPPRQRGPPTQAVPAACPAAQPPASGRMPSPASVAAARQKRRRPGRRGPGPARTPGTRLTRLRRLWQWTIHERPRKRPPGHPTRSWGPWVPAGA